MADLHLRRPKALTRNASLGQTPSFNGGGGVGASSPPSHHVHCRLALPSHDLSESQSGVSSPPKPLRSSGSSQLLPGHPSLQGNPSSQEDNLWALDSPNP